MLNNVTYCDENNCIAGCLFLNEKRESGFCVLDGKIWIKRSSYNTSMFTHNQIRWDILSRYLYKTRQSNFVLISILLMSNYKIAILIIIILSINFIISFLRFFRFQSSLYYFSKIHRNIFVSYESLCNDFERPKAIGPRRSIILGTPGQSYYW